MFSEDSESSLKAFELPSSVWKLILSMCPSREVDEVRKVLGESLVEQACDLHEEASALHEIWQQLKLDSDSKLAQLEESKRSMSFSSLPEPPAMRERLVQEIQFFVSYLKQKAEEKGHSAAAVANGVGRLLDSPDNKDVFDYVARSSLKGERDLISRGSSASGSVCSRPMSAVSSRDGRETPLRLHTPNSASEGGSQVSLLSDRVEAVNQHVNAFDIDTVVKHLREVLEEECDQCREDIAFLQSCLDGEHEFISTTLEEELKPEPTLQELRELGTKLEHEVLETASPHRPPGSPHTQPLPSRAGLLPSLIPKPPSTSSPNTKHVVNRASRVKYKAKHQLHQNLDTALAATNDRSSSPAFSHLSHQGALNYQRDDQPVTCTCTCKDNVHVHAADGRKAEMERAPTTGTSEIKCCTAESDEDIQSNNSRTHTHTHQSNTDGSADHARHTCTCSVGKTHQTRHTDPENEWSDYRVVKTAHVAHSLPTNHTGAVETRQPILIQNFSNSKPVA